MADPQTLADLITATRNRTLTWSDHPDPQAMWHGRLVFIGRLNGVYIRTRMGWDQIGVSPELRHAIEATR